MSIPQEVLNFVTYLTTGGPNGGPLTQGQTDWERRQNSRSFDNLMQLAYQYGLINNPKSWGGNFGAGNACYKPDTVGTPRG